MRITGGKARGIPLKAPAGERTRPATDRMREALFSSIGPQIEGLRVADLFAGTGAYGLEALSRGAASVTFFEQDKRALTCLKQNVQATLKSLQAPNHMAQISTGDLFQSAPRSGVYDIVFVDPPYDQIEANLARLFEQVLDPITSAEAMIAFELPGQITPELTGWSLYKRLGKVKRDQPTVALLRRA